MISEPAVATDGKRIFYTANYLAASSNNGGKNWTLFDLRGTWSQKFCCDQDVIFDPQDKVFIWYAQAWPSKTDGEKARIEFCPNIFTFETTRFYCMQLLEF